MKDRSKCEKVDELKGSHNAEAKNETEKAAKRSWKDKVIAAYINIILIVWLTNRVQKANSERSPCGI